MEQPFLSFFLSFPFLCLNLAGEKHSSKDCLRTTSHHVAIWGGYCNFNASLLSTSAEDFHGFVVQVTKQKVQQVHIKMHVIYEMKELLEIRQFAHTNDPFT